MIADIYKTELVAGNTLSDNWEQPMTIIQTNIGSFIDYGANFDHWQAAQDEGWAYIETMPCWRTKRHTWAKLMQFRDGTNYDIAPRRV